MGRANWIDDDNHPDLDAHVNQLEHFTAAIADGRIDEDELARQQANLVAAMREVEPLLDDALHAKVTHLLAELAAYTVMELLHEMTQAKVQAAIK